jgi:class 3 adenylate cyclase
MNRFNEALLNFAFELRMGFNFGPVTAGSIGTTKLFYDIWGIQLMLLQEWIQLVETEKFKFWNM